MLQTYTVQHIGMPLRAINQLRQNVASLLRARGLKQNELAFYLKRHPTTINKFLTGKREVQLEDLDRMADFFGLATYQLFQPGISPLTERRSNKDRRRGQDRRMSHVQRLEASVRPQAQPTLSDEDAAILMKLRAVPELLEALRLMPAPTGQRDTQLHKPTRKKA